MSMLEHYLKLPSSMLLEVTFILTNTRFAVNNPGLQFLGAQILCSFGKCINKIAARIKQSHEKKEEKNSLIIL